MTILMHYKIVTRSATYLQTVSLYRPHCGTGHEFTQETFHSFIKGIAIRTQARTGPECSGWLRLPEFLERT